VLILEINTGISKKNPMTQHNKNVLLVILSLLLLGACYWLYAGSRGSQPNIAVDTNAQMITTVPVARAQIATAKEMASPAFSEAFFKTSAGKLARRFESSHDNKKFIEEARAQPLSGGVYLALKAEADCSLTGYATAEKTIKDNADFIPLTAPNRNERLAAVRKLYEKCSGFDGSPMKLAELRELIKEGKRLGDPILKLQDDLRAAVAEETTKIAPLLQSAVDSKNPYMVSEAMTILATLLPSDDQAYPSLFNFSINGVAIPPEDSYAARAAMELIPCQYGLDCSPDSRYSLFLCVAGRACGQDWYEHNREAMMSDGSRMRYYYDQIMNAFNTGNFGSVSIGPSKTPR
jgi:hypothetical protein